jgi:hypothetical protein
LVDQRDQYSFVGRHEDLGPTCRQLQVMLIGSTMHTADFKFK